MLKDYTNKIVSKDQYTHKKPELKASKLTSVREYMKITGLSFVQADRELKKIVLLKEEEAKDKR